MKAKYLEKKMEIAADVHLLGHKSPIELEYYLLESDINDAGELKGEKTYGIEIVKKVNEVNVERQFVSNFSCCREETRKVLGKLANNTVTPIGLYCVLDDIIGV